MFEIFIFLIRNILGSILPEALANVAGEDAPIPDDILAPAVPCTQDDKTFTVDIKVHLEESVIKAIHSVAQSNVAANETEREAVASYLGTIFDELNLYLLSLKVQVHLKLDAYNIDQFMATISVDPSCEKTSPVIERTSAAFDFLQESYSGNIGVHIFVWGCINVPPNSDLKSIFNSYRCGRVGGLMWRGMYETRELIKNTIIDIFSSLEHINLKSPALKENIQKQVCQYVQECIGMKPTELGQLVGGSLPVRYTDDELLSPATETALVEMDIAGQ